MSGFVQNSMNVTVRHVRMVARVLMESTDILAPVSRASLDHCAKQVCQLGVNTVQVGVLDPRCDL